MSFLLPQPDHPVATDWLCNNSNLIIHFFLLLFVFYPKDKCKHFKSVCVKCVLLMVELILTLIDFFI